MTVLSIFVALALVVCPVAYALLCRRMKREGVRSPPYLPFFFLFGTLGGWLLAVAVSPSGMAAAFLIFLVTVAPIALVASSLRLWKKKERSIYDRIAQVAGFGYPALLLVWALVIVIFARET